MKATIIEAAHQRGLPALPGAFSPTEVQRAHELDADIIKIFPANIVGMDYFKAILAPLPHLKLMPTGGVTLDNAGDWLRAGACADGGRGRGRAMGERALAVIDVGDDGEVSGGHRESSRPARTAA